MHFPTFSYFNSISYISEKGKDLENSHVSLEYVYAPYSGKGIRFGIVFKGLLGETDADVFDIKWASGKRQYNQNLRYVGDLLMAVIYFANYPPRNMWEALPNFNIKMWNVSGKKLLFTIDNYS